ncbi:MAG: HAMP domain-containing protein [Gammaproteobacteria bacterium]|nr:HAMP domain-containing protein [Gammaproteobacteria bacterium]
MRIKIWHKLFFTILLVVLLILAINMGLSRFSFQQGFTQYIEEVRLKRLDGFKQTLSDLYRQQGAWTFLEQDPRLWHQLLSEAELVPPQRRRGDPDHRRRPPPGFGPPGLATSNEHPIPPPPLMGERIGLLDPAHSPVIGPPPAADDRLVPVELGKEVVGYLSVRTFTPYRSELDQQFAQQQLENLLLTALLSLLIAIIASLLLARIFNRPIARLAEVARQLTSGNFESRVNVKSRDELGDLATDLNILAETLQQNQTARRQWVADISHELRTPLTVLKGELEAMEDGVRPLNSESLL